MHTLPKISIITPSFNQSNYIEKTILSVINQKYINIEYIIIDGGSTDGSTDIIKKYENTLSYWVSEPDRGQSHAINKGLERATGQIFNWLNSDDYLEPNALQRIAEAWRTNPDAAAWVGACKRMTPTGHELNVIFPNNLSLSNIGENWNGRQFYQPACFMNMSYIKELGGVNESLEFCMDLDLWMRLARRGFFLPGQGIWANAIIHPEAKTQKSRAEMHLETAKLMISHGFIDGGRNRYESNFNSKADKFIIPAELKNALQIQNDSNAMTPPEGKGKSIVMISDFMPRFDASSSQLRVSHLIKILAAGGFSIDYLYFVSDPKDAQYAAAHQGNIRFHYVTLDSKILLKKALLFRPDILWITNIWTTQYLNTLQVLVGAIRQELTGTRIILDTMDYHAKKFFRKFKTSRNMDDLHTAQEFSAGESTLYPLGHDIVTVTEDEKRDLEQNIPNCPPIWIIPNVHVVCKPKIEFNARRGMVFLGNFSVNHNYDAMDYFISKIWPHIFARRKDISLHVVGREADTKLGHLRSKNIILHGYVKDLDTFLDKFRVFVCPMTYGAGMKGKIGSALSSGLPVVTTSIGAEGFPLEDGENCFIADDPEEFALKCLHLHDDTVCWNNFSIKGRFCISELASIRSASRKLAHLIDINSHVDLDALHTDTIENTCE
ncbi:MAG: glycosyltransferase [Negativicutes bacterium]|nr:glycosyltransferase [Negativicutes bacterium]